MRRLAAAIALGVVSLTGVAFADTIQNSYGNTIIVTYANGSQAQYFFNEDGTFTALAPGGSTMAGRYTVGDGQICLIPPNGAAPTCTPVQAGKNVGDTWTQPGSDGSEISVELRAGRP